jgi:hypothetical protein
MTEVFQDNRCYTQAQKARYELIKQSALKVQGKRKQATRQQIELLTEQLIIKAGVNNNG